MRKSNTFRRSLFWTFLIVTFLPLICLVLISYSYLKATIESAGIEANEFMAKTVAAEISSSLLAPEITVRQIATLVRSEQKANENVNALLDLLVAQSDYLEAVFIVDRRKHVINVGLDEQFRDIADNYMGMDLSELALLDNIEYLQGPIWSNVFFSPISDKKSIALITPLDDERYVIGHINIDFFHSDIATRIEGKEISLIILDDNGSPVFHPQLKKVAEQQSYGGIEPYRRAQLGKYGTSKFRYAEREYIGSTANIGAAKWTVVIVQSLASANEPLRNMTSLFGFAVVIALIIVITFSIRQSRRLLQPLEDLQKSILAVAEGNYQENVPQQSLVEFEQVADHFRHMALAIKKRQELLEINEERLVSLLEVHNLKGLEEGELLVFALEQAVQLTRSEFGYLHLLGGQGEEIVKSYWSRNTEAFCRRCGVSLDDLKDLEVGAECVIKRKALLSNTLGLVRQEEKKAAALDIKNHLADPIFDGDTVVAVVGVVNKEFDYDNTDARQLSLYFNHTWDILQQKRYEKERERLAEQLAQAQKLEAIGTLAGGIAHDFNNVLMVIIGNTELARDNLQNPERVRGDLEEIFKASLRARDLVKQILAFSRDQTERLKPLDIQPIVKEALKLLRSSIPSNIEIRSHIDSESYEAMMEPGQVKQVIMNLCTNAYQAMEKEEGILTVGLHPVILEEGLFRKGDQVLAAGRYIQLVVQDTGNGIPAESIERIFEPYFSTRQKQRGTGLGLAVVHGIVKSMKGAITVDSVQAVGTTFTVYLPVVQSGKGGESDVLGGKLPGGSESILYVDDDQAVADVNSKMLEKLGYRVTTFYSSKEALAEFTAVPANYDLIITDMDMPDITGDVLAAKLKEVRQDICIMLCTGYSETIEKERIIEIGVSDVLIKPLTKIDLALTVRKVLGYQMTDDG